MYTTCCKCTTCMSGVLRGQTRIPDSLELESWMVVSIRVGAGDQTQVLCKSNRYSELLGWLSSPALKIFRSGL